MGLVFRPASPFAFRVLRHIVKGSLCRVTMIGIPLTTTERKTMKMTCLGKKGGMPVNRRDVRKHLATSHKQKQILKRIHMRKQSRLPRILDKDITFDNYANFLSCTIDRSGKEVIFSFPVGAQYRVNVKQFLSWYTNPHSIIMEDGVLTGWPQGKEYHPKEGITFLKTELVIKGFAARIFMSDSTVYDVGWNIVLMTCEPRYQWYGGLSERIKNIIRDENEKRSITPIPFAILVEP